MAEKTVMEKPTVDDDKKKIGYFYALVHVVKGVIGVGLFALGYAIKNGGIFLGPPLLFIMGIIAVHCQHQLVNCAEKVIEYSENEKSLDYATAVELCFKNGPGKVPSFSRAAYLCINIFICLTQFGFCCVYIVFISKNMTQMLDTNGIQIELRLMILIVWFPIWIVCLITNLKTLAPVSIAANVLIMSSFLSTMAVAYMGEMKKISELKPYTTPWQYAMFLGTVIFSFETIALVLPVRNAMKNPKLYGMTFGALNAGMCIVMVLYFMSGITGYLRWGEDVQSSLTLHLGTTAFSQCIQIAVSLGIMLTYPLHFYPPIHVLLPGFLKFSHLTQQPMIGELLFRTLMTICTVIVAELVPNIGLFITLIGALCSTTLALVFPPITECLLLHKSSHSRFIKTLIVLKNILILIVAATAFTVSSTISTIEIVEDYLK